MAEWDITGIELTRWQQERLKTWLLVQAFPAAVEAQRQSCDDLPDELRAAFEEMWAQGRPYYGAAGAGVTISFRPSNLGALVTACEPISGQEISLTDMVML